MLFLLCAFFLLLYEFDIVYLRVLMQMRVRIYYLVLKERLREADTDPGAGTADHHVWARHDRDREDGFGQDAGLLATDAAPRDGSAAARRGRRPDRCHLHAHARARTANLQRVSAPVATSRAPNHLPLRRRRHQRSDRATQAGSGDRRLHSWPSH